MAFQTYRGWEPRTLAEDAEVQRRGMQNWVLARMDIIEYVLMSPHSHADMSPIGPERRFPMACEC